MRGRALPNEPDLQEPLLPASAVVVIADETPCTTNAIDSGPRNGLLLPQDDQESLSSSPIENGASSSVSPNPDFPDQNGEDRDEPTDTIQNPWKNHNVILSFVLCAVSGLADSIWSSVVLSGYLLALAGAMGQSAKGNTLVGTAEAVQGLTQLLTALPVGFLADTWSKSKTMKLGGAIMLLTIALNLWALLDINRWADENNTVASRCFIILVVALGLWGLVTGISYGPSQALFADSIPRGKRSEMLTWLYSFYLLSSAVGPIVSIVLILTVSANAEDWSLKEIFPVFFLGVCLEIPAALLMFFFNDKYVVPEESSPGPTSTAEPVSEVLASSAEIGNGHLATAPVPSVGANGCETDTETPPCLNGHNDDTNEIGGVDQAPLLGRGEESDEALNALARTRKKYKGCIPYVIFISSLISSLGSGASVKYFPLFFKEVGFGSAAVQGIFLLVPIFISAFSFVAQVAGKRMGRVEATVGSILIGVALLLGMTWLSQGVGKSSDSDAQPSMRHDNPHRALIVVAVYLFRTGIINCSYPLLESILMDSVPSNQRARWKSLESIASFGWTGSAFIGGILSDTHSYQFTFTMTAWMQLASGVLLLLIQPLVEEEGT
jgi:MFS family permease